MIQIEGLTIGFPSDTGAIPPVVRGVSLKVEAGERVGLVGESGSGKSLVALACLGLVPEPGQLLGGSVVVDETHLFPASEAELQRTRGGIVGLVVQEAAASLNPVYTVGFQLAETIRTHHHLSRKEGKERALSLLAEVALDDGPAICRAYPHELSGGQVQRVMIALALAGEPSILVADEATSALDLVTQAEVLGLLENLTLERGMGLLLISHDLTVVRRVVERTYVMFGGEIVEEGLTADLFATPLHPYTKMLLDSAPGKRGTDPIAEIDGSTIMAPADSGCRFNPRCRLARTACRETAPQLVEISENVRVRCPVVAEALKDVSDAPR